MSIVKESYKKSKLQHASIHGGDTAKGNFEEGALIRLDHNWTYWSTWETQCVVEN